MRRFDFDRYLHFLRDHEHNFVRLWAWEVPNPRSARYERRIHAAPQAWLRTGPGVDVTGLPKFDLDRPDPEYFRRLRERVAAALDQGIYVSVMLFEGWAAQFEHASESHPFNAPNNVNGIHYGDDARDIYTLKYPDITSIQEEHVRRVIDAVNEFDNVLYEIVNEAGAFSTEWQMHMIEIVREYQAQKLKRHPVGMTAQYPDGRNETMFSSAADWISPHAGPGGEYLIAPPVDSRKVIIADTDHLGGSGSGTREWVWRAFTRGLNVAFMDRYFSPDSVSDRPYARAYEVRVAMGEARLVAEVLNLASMQPRPELASTRFAMAGDGRVLVYQPTADRFFVDLAGLEGPLESEWFDTETGEVTRGEPPAQAGSRASFKSPSGNPSLLLLQPADEGEPALLSVADRIRRVRATALTYLPWKAQARERLRGWLSRWAPNPGYRHIAVGAFAGAGAGALLVLAIVATVHCTTRRT